MHVSYKSRRYTCRPSPRPSPDHSHFQPFLILVFHSSCYLVPPPAFTTTSMATLTQPTTGSSTEKVLTNYELLEMILLRLPQRDILTSAHRVCRSFHAVVKRSHPIQERLFFRQTSIPGLKTDRITGFAFNELVAEFLHSRHASVYYHKSIRISHQFYLGPERTRTEGSWLDMYPTSHEMEYTHVTKMAYRWRGEAVFDIETPPGGSEREFEPLAQLRYRELLDMAVELVSGHHADDDPERPRYREVCLKFCIQPRRRDS